MKIRPKVPVCTDCDHVFEYKGRNPGQLGGVVVFADGPNEAAMLAFSFLAGRNEILHKDDDDGELSGQKNNRKG